MNNQLIETKTSADLKDDQLGCFGTFTLDDRICRSFCALRLRCAVEQSQNMHMEMLEELIFSDSPHMKNQ